MRNGIEAASLSPALPYAAPINEACARLNATQSPLLCYAIAYRETIVEFGSGSAAVVSDDGGHGLFQLTASFPDNWQSAYVNACYAIDEFITPAEVFWAKEVQGEDLVRCIAAEFNAGRSAALRGHEEGNVDAYTTNGYAEAVLGYYQNLVTRGAP